MRKVKGTFLESNTYSTTAERLELARTLGFAAVAPVDIMDDEGSIDLPVPHGMHLKVHRVGSHFANYDSLVSIVRFKLHNLPQLGGTMKNLSITLSPFSGRCNIHSAGRSFSWQEVDPETTAESITDAVKAALAARTGRWAFLCVMPGFAPRDKCPGAVDLGDVGVFASLDPVALDAVCTGPSFGYERGFRRFHGDSFGIGTGISEGKGDSRDGSPGTEACDHIIHIGKVLEDLFPCACAVSDDVSWVSELVHDDGVGGVLLQFLRLVDAALHP